MFNDTTDDRRRSRSLLRQMRDTFVGRSLSRSLIDNRFHSTNDGTIISNKGYEFEAEPTAKVSRKARHRTAMKLSTPVSFSHHRSLINQVKSHLIGHRKNVTNRSSTLLNTVSDHEKWRTNRISFRLTDSNAETRSVLSFCSAAFTANYANR
jgi:hypothetical protein